MIASLYQSGSCALPGRFRAIVACCVWRFSSGMTSLRLENQDRQRRQRYVQRIGTSMGRQRTGLRASAIALPAAAVESSVAVQHLHPVAFFGNAHAIVLPRHGREITDRQDVILTVLPEPQQADDAALIIVAIHPL